MAGIMEQDSCYMDCMFFYTYKNCFKARTSKLLLLFFEYTLFKMYFMGCLSSFYQYENQKSSYILHTEPSIQPPCSTSHYTVRYKTRMPTVSEEALACCWLFLGLAPFKRYRCLVAKTWRPFHSAQSVPAPLLSLFADSPTVSPQRTDIGPALWSEMLTVPHSHPLFEWTLRCPYY